MKNTAYFFAAALLLVASAARAQDTTTPQRHVTTDPGSGMSIGPWLVSFAPFDGYDHTGFGKNGTAPTFIKTDPLQQSGQRGGLTTTVIGTKRRETTELSFAGGSTSTYLFNGQKMLTDGNAAAGQAIRIGPRSSIAFVESVSYAPYYSLGLFPDLDHDAAGSYLSIPVVPTFALGVSDASVQRTDLGEQFTHEITDQTVLEGHASLHWTRIRADTGEHFNGSYQDIGARVTHRLSQSFGYHAGYGFERASYPGTAVPTMFHNVDLGVDFRKPLSASRRTILSFSTGSTIIQYQNANGVQLHQKNTQYRLLASADLEQYIGRTWTARVSYRRDLQLLDGFSSPFYRNAVSAGIGGKLNSRTAAGVKSSYLRGSLEGQPGNDSGHAFTTTSYVQMIVRGDLAVFGQYTYYQHHFESAAPGLNLPLQFNRSSLRFGLAIALPTSH